ncbi:MAG: hypothetical protein Q7R47_00810, partial [Candidatus Diapherotrites archaeon]|nr:hypothetical protein [Candidatus Diapherotrites archaeon]
MQHVPVFSRTSECDPQQPSSFFGSTGNSDINGACISVDAGDDPLQHAPLFAFFDVGRSACALVSSAQHSYK